MRNIEWLLLVVSVLFLCSSGLRVRRRQGGALDEAAVIFSLVILAAIAVRVFFIVKI